MVQSNIENKDFKLKFFQIDEQHAYAQFQATMSEQDYDQLTGSVQGKSKSSNQGKVLIQCLDKSGSMYGAPMTALKAGAIIVGESIFGDGSGDNAFQRIITLPYGSQVSISEDKVKDQYETMITKMYAGSMTNFKSVFDKIQSIVIDDKNMEDLTVIFFTDGQDTSNDKTQLANSLKELTNLLKNHKSVSSKILSIGFSSGHDAVFMNQIAQSGSELGNFMFIDTSNPDYKEQIKFALQDSLSIAMQGQDAFKFQIKSEFAKFSEQVNAEKNFVYSQMDEEGNVPENGKADIVLSQSMILDLNAVEDLRASVIFKGEVKEIFLQKELVSDPTADLRMKAGLSLVGKKLFQRIQDAQASNLSPEERQDNYEKIKELDRELDQYSEQIMKISSKELRQSFMEEFIESKKKTSQVIDILRQSANGQISNLQIAQLNDVGYKAIRKVGVQKKLDERAIKNEGLYKNLDAQIQKSLKNMDFKALRMQHKDIIDMISCCPMSQNDVIEAMEAGDCMCISLQISRSEATISDPTKLRIQKIIPTFMTLDSFLDSSIFNLKKNSDASGGFDYNNQGKLALGLGREEITGVIPLFLFKEHWEIAKRKIQSLLGFMCTLDPLGYASSQFFTVPFLVLLQAMQEPKSESMQRNYQLILDTCKNICAFSSNMKNQIVEQVAAFSKNPASRTADVIPSIHVLAAQLYTYLQLSEEQKQVQIADPQASQEAQVQFQTDMLEPFVRFGIEEVLRRVVKIDEPISKTQVLNSLYPVWKVCRDETHLRFQKEMESSAPEGIEHGKYTEFVYQANILRSLDKANKIAEDPQSNDTSTTDKNEEVKAEPEEESKEEQKVDILQIVKQVVGDKPWEASLETEDSVLMKMLNGGTKLLGSRHTDLVICLFDKLLNKGPVDQENAVETLLSCPMIEGDKLIYIAMCMQNALHPKNNQRTTAISENRYKEIRSRQDADKFLSDLLSDNLTKELMGVQSSLIAQKNQHLQDASTLLLIGAPDKYICATILQTNKICLGQGGRTSFYNSLLNSSLAELNTIPDLAGKLHYFASGKAFGKSIYNDRRVLEQSSSTTKKQMVFKLWMKLSREAEIVTIEQMIAIFPNKEMQLNLYDKCIDENGQPTLDLDYFIEYCQMSDSEKIKKKQIFNAKKAQKKLL